MFFQRTAYTVYLSTIKILIPIYYPSKGLVTNHWRTIVWVALLYLNTRDLNLPNMSCFHWATSSKLSFLALDQDLIAQLSSQFSVSITKNSCACHYSSCQYSWPGILGQWVEWITLLEEVTSTFQLIRWSTTGLPPWGIYKSQFTIHTIKWF